MSTETVTAPTTTESAKSKPAKKPAPKAKPKAKAKPESKVKTFHGVECSNGKFWNAKRILIVQALRKLNATSATAGRTAEEIAKKAGAADMEAGNVTRYCADQEPLVAGGLVKKAILEDKATTCFYLTALGTKCGFEY